MPKRQNLADFEAEVTAQPEPLPAAVSKPKSIHKTVYIPPRVLDQLDLLAIQERNEQGRGRTFTSLVLEGLDLLFKSRGLSSVAELDGE